MLADVTPPVFERAFDGAIHRLGHAEIVRVDDQQPRTCGVAEPLHQRHRLGRRRFRGMNAEEQAA